MTATRREALTVAFLVVAMIGSSLAVTTHAQCTPTPLGAGTGCDGVDNDCDGVSDSCLEDITPPQIQCPPDQVMECGEIVSSGLAARTNALVIPGGFPPNAADDCSDVALSVNETVTQDCGNAGTVERVWTATDACGNASSCVQVVTFVDTQPPLLECPPDVALPCDQPADPGVTGQPSLLDQCDPNPQQAFTDIVQPGPGPGETTILRTWTAADDCGNAAQCEQVITLLGCDGTHPCVDGDGDGFGVGDTSQCANPGVEDCDDTRDDVHPGAAELCDGRDNDCDGQTDEAATDAPTWYADGDGDGFGRGGDGVQACEAPAGHVDNDLDCDDTDAAVNPQAPELCDGRDNDCDGQIDEDVADVSAPELTCPDTAVVACDASRDPGATGEAVATDDCDPEPVVTYLDSVESGSCPGQQVVTRTWSATDAGGNVASCVQALAVEDTSGPGLAILHPANGDVLTDDLTAVPLQAAAVDNCDPAPSVSFAVDQTPLSGAALDVSTLSPGPHTLTARATDGCGNTTTAAISFIVETVQPQPNTITPLDPVGDCVSNVTQSVTDTTVTFTWEYTGSFSVFTVVISDNPCGKVPVPPDGPITPEPKRPQKPTETKPPKQDEPSGPITPGPDDDEPERTAPNLPLPPGWEWTDTGPVWTGEGEPVLPPGWEYDPLGIPRWAGEGAEPVAQPVITTSGPIAAPPPTPGQPTVVSCQIPLEGALEPGQAFVYQVHGVTTDAAGELTGYLSDPECLRYAPEDPITGEPPLPRPCPECESRLVLDPTPAMDGGLVPNNENLEIRIDEVVPLHAVGLDFDRLIWRCVPNDNCPEDGSQRIRNLTGKVRFQWRVIGGEGGFVQGDFVDRAVSSIDVGEHVLFQPPDLDVCETKITTLMLEILDDNPSQPIDGAVQRVITVTTRRLPPSGKEKDCRTTLPVPGDDDDDDDECKDENAAEFDEECPKEMRNDDCDVLKIAIRSPAFSLPKPTVFSDTVGECRAMPPKWLQNNDLNATILPPVTDEICAKQRLRLYAADLQDPDVVKLVCQSETCTSTQTARVFNDDLRWTWYIVKGGGRFIKGNQGRIVIYEAPDGPAEVEVMVIVDNPWGLQVGDSLKQAKRELCVVKVDIDTDSDNNGKIEDKDDPIEVCWPGNLVCYNGDDDDKNAMPDRKDDGAQSGGVVTVDNEDDLDQTNLSVQYPPCAIGSKVVLRHGEGASRIRVWEEETKGKRIELPKSYTLGVDTIPASVWVEGYETGPATLEWVFRNKAGMNVCKDVVRFLVVRVEFIETAESANETDLLNLFNPSPVVTLEELADPGGGDNPEVEVTGTVLSFIAPVDKDHVFVNGKKVEKLEKVCDGPNECGPFVRKFTSKKIRIGNDDFAVVAAAVNAVENIGYDSIGIKVDRKDDGTIDKRVVDNALESVPKKPDNIADYLDKFRFRIEVVDDSKFPDEKKLEVEMNSGVETRKLELRLDCDAKAYRSEHLYLCPDNLDIPGDAPKKVKETRFKGKFGTRAYVDWKHAKDDTCRDEGIPAGILFRTKKDDKIVRYINSGIAKDVKTADDKINFTIEAGGDGKELGTEIPSTVRSLDKKLAELQRPDPNAHYALVEITGDPVKLTRQSDDTKDPQYNQYKSDKDKPLVGLRTQMPLDKDGQPQDNADLVELHVSYRGYAKVTSTSIADAENIEPVMGLQTIVAKPADPNGDTEQHPPMEPADFIPVFNPGPVVLITTPAAGVAPIGGGATNIDVRGEVISFAGPLTANDVTVNGTAVTTLTQDANNQPTGPWRATFRHNAAVDLQMAVQTIVVSAADRTRNQGRDSITLTAAGGGVDGNGNAVAVNQRSVTHNATLPDSPAVTRLIDDNTVHLREAMVFVRNRQFRIEGNPILRGELDWMFGVDKVRTSRQTDAAGAERPNSAVEIPLDIPNGNDTTPAGGAFNTGRFVLLPEAPPAPAEQHDAKRAQLAGDPGQFLRSFVDKHDLRPETASPEGALIMESDVLQADVVIPGHQTDVGTNPADITLRARIGASGFDDVGAGRPTITARLKSLDHDGNDLGQPDPRPISRNDLAPPAGVADRSQWENFAFVLQSLDLHRLSDDPLDPRFNLFRYKEPDPSNNEELVTPVSTGTFPAANSRFPAFVRDNIDRGLHHVQPAGWLLLEANAIPTGTAVEPVFGAYAPEADAVSTITATAGAEINSNFARDRDFCIQLQERPVFHVHVVTARDAVVAANNFMLRTERTAVLATTDLVPAPAAETAAAPATGFQVVAYLDVDTAGGASHQHQASLTGSGTRRFPPAGAGFATLIRVGTATATHAVSFANATNGASQTAFEGINLPNVLITQATGAGARRALPPGKYWVRPVMHSPDAGSRMVLGNAVSVTVPYVTNFTPVGAFLTSLRNQYGLVAATVPAGQQTTFRNAFIAQMARLVRTDYGSNTAADNRDLFTAGAVSIRITHPNIPTPQIQDFVVPVTLGGFTAAGDFGAANSLDVLNNLTDETAFSGGSQIRVGALSGLGGVRGTNLFSTFVGGGATAYGGMGGDNIGALSTALNGGALAGPGALANRNDRAQNAAVAVARTTAATLSHEIAHTLGLVGTRADMIAYMRVGGRGAWQGLGLAPAQYTRANGVNVGNEWDFVSDAAGQVAHNGQIVATPTLPGPPAGTGQAAGQLPSYQQAVTARAAGAVPSDCDDLRQAPLNGQNLMMDSGTYGGGFPEAMAVAATGVIVNPAFPAAQQEPAVAFLARNLLQLQAVLPGQ